MDLYLYPSLRGDPILSGLTAMRREVYAPLLKFAEERGFTTQTAREYAIRAALKTPLGVDLSLALPYLKSDAQTIYSTFFTPDWDEKCAENGLLPLPRGVGNAPGEDGYKRAVASMVNAATADELFELMRGFYAENTDEAEAMYRAFSWDGGLQGIAKPDTIELDELGGLEPQKAALLENTAAFISGRPANDVLLTGASGTGKSSCVKALLNRFAQDGLRLAEVRRSELHTLPALLDVLSRKRRRYIVFI
ncbi:MAG: ATP-binding protein, partial [Oscillospiraceae bacterium]|nr:ATP-binding protein [Oscillospiraceae bacterium]